MTLGTGTHTCQRHRESMTAWLSGSQVPFGWKEAWGVLERSGAVKAGGARFCRLLHVAPLCLSFVLKMRGRQW